MSKVYRVAEQNELFFFIDSTYTGNQVSSPDNVNHSTKASYIIESWSTTNMVSSSRSMIPSGLCFAHLNVCSLLPKTLYLFTSSRI